MLISRLGATHIVMIFVTPIYLAALMCLDLRLGRKRLFFYINALHVITALANVPFS